MGILDRNAVLVLVFTVLGCGGTTSDPGSAGGSGGSSGGGAAAGSGGTAGVDCSHNSCGAPPLCDVGCQEPCGCCGCSPGQVQRIGGVDHICLGGCWAPRTDGGASCNLESGCPADSFCRPLESGGAACAPYAGEGDTCGVYTAVWAEARCAPDLVCTDAPPALSDASGKCRVSCASDANCPSDRYCASGNDVCRDDGTCFDDLDCDEPGNAYPGLACVGYGDCMDGACTYLCGSSYCRDLGDTFFGHCEAELGWAVVNGQCTLVSGCDSRGYAFFFISQSACLTTCN